MIRIVAALCHGTAIVPKTPVSTGELLVAGKTWTGFKNEEERVAEAHVGRRIQLVWMRTRHAGWRAPASSPAAPSRPSPSAMEA